MTFKLRIELGNDAMRMPLDVWGALNQVSDELFLDPDRSAREMDTHDNGRIMDRTGNTVGRWEVKA